MSTAGDGISPLSGVKVLDLSRVLAGPWCTQILADFGADVVKIEEPGRGDDTRMWGPPFLPSADPKTEAHGGSAYFASCNRNKRSVALNFADPAGADLVRRLAAEADVLVENFRPGGLAKYGLDYAEIRAINPRIVYTSITGFGQQSPYASRSGYDYVAQAMSGLMSVTGEPDGRPTKVGVPISDLSTGLYAAISTLIALRDAERTGEGQHIDCSLLDCQVAMLGNLALTYLVGDYVPTRHGNSHPTVVPGNVYEAADGPVVIAPGNDKQFKALCVALGVPEMAGDPRFLTNSDRSAHRAFLDARIQELVGNRPCRALVDRLVASGVPASPVNTIGQILEDAFITERGGVHHFEEGGVRIPSVAYPARLSKTPPVFDRAPPRLGRDTVEALQDWLAVEPSELEGMIASGVLRDGTGRPEGAQ
jgi:crotonobetainyl-CoA:carnitine CoA-transferase CaiB-like acyl-CoA transferase